ncbi:MAG: alkaline phosphatase family protein [Polaromonas sp.]|nr:alkaline phosphatase family protein [Polaromonas sp.]
MRSRTRTFIALLATVVLAACASPPTPQAPPKLVVLLVVDGLPQRQITAYRDQLAPDGLARFLDRGAWFADAHYEHAFTVTAAGHATLLTGAYPHRTGIIGNSWRDPATGAPIYNTADSSATYIDHRTDPVDDGTSPKNLKAETVGDVLRHADAASKVIAVSGKDRGAILPAGKAGTAYMYMDESGQFASSTHYMKEHPAWVNAFNDAKPADRYFKTEWKPLLPDAAYARSLPDNQPWYARGGQLPALMGSPADISPTPSFYAGLLRSPFADALALDFARAAIAGEQLGQDASPDILAISLSGHDYVNHAFSAESRLSHDHLLQLDRLLQAFFLDLDARVGKGNYLAVLTADHGFMPAPEVLAAQGLAAGRVSSSLMLGRINAGLVARFGPGRWASFSASSLLLDKKLVAQTQADANVVIEEARRLLLAEPAIATAYTRRELESRSRAGEPSFDASEKSWHRDVSGDIQYTVRQNWMFGGSTGATHGSPYDYDNHVPLLMYGPAWMKPGRIDSRVHMTGLAPTLSGILGIATPAMSEGRVLPLQAP